MSELVVRGLTKSFGPTQVLRGLDLHVPSGSVAAVLGPSGGGKTTLLRVIAGFERADAGTVQIGGTTVAGGGRDVPPERRRVGVVPQEGALFPHLSVAGNVGYGLPRAARRRGRVAELLELVGLAGYGERMPRELSGGQQQRVAVARALAPDPSLVLLDEPFSALDSALRGAVREDVRIALHVAGATAVLVTHDQQEALSVADLVAVLRDGRVVQSGPPAQVYGDPVDVGVATFVGEAVVLPGRLHDGVVDCALGRLPARRGPGAQDGTSRVVIRPEQVELAAVGAGVPARVIDSVFYGHDSLIRLTLPEADPPGLQVSARSLAGTVMNPGDLVGLVVAGPVACFAASGSDG